LRSAKRKAPKLSNVLAWAAKNKQTGLAAHKRYNNHIQAAKPAHQQLLILFRAPPPPLQKAKESTFRQLSNRIHGHVLRKTRNWINSRAAGNATPTTPASVNNHRLIFWLRAMAVCAKLGRRFQLFNKHTPSASTTAACERGRQPGRLSLARIYYYYTYIMQQHTLHNDAIIILIERCASLVFIIFNASDPAPLLRIVLFWRGFHQGLIKRIRTNERPSFYSFDPNSAK
jgi:hypothetical protein